MRQTEMVIVAPLSSTRTGTVQSGLIARNAGVNCSPLACFTQTTAKCLNSICALIAR